MAEPISLASGIVALATFAFKSSVSLYQVVDSFQNNQRTMRRLKEEVESLNGVLLSLQKVAAGNSAAGLEDLKGLNLPLLRCGKACNDFEAEIIKCTAHSSSGGSRTSFRDWAKLKYMGDDISGFRNMLAGYKATIIIALGDANFRISAVTDNLVKDYKSLLTDTTSDLDERLTEISARLQALATEATISVEDAAERDRMQEEKDSTKQCLTICAQASQHVDQVRTHVFEDVSADRDSHQVIISTSGDLIVAKRIRAGVGATQWLGQMSDAVTEQLSQYRGLDVSCGRAATGNGKEKQMEITAKFQDQFGAGHKLR